MEETDIPILHSAYQLYKTVSSLRKLVPKAERRALATRGESDSGRAGRDFSGEPATERSEGIPSDVRERQTEPAADVVAAREDTKVIDLKRYAELQKTVDEIGRMLGGWIKSTKISNGSPLKGFL